MKAKKTVLAIASVITVSSLSAGTDYNLIAKATELLIDKSEKNEKSIIEMRSQLDSYEKSMQSSKDALDKSSEASANKVIMLEKQMEENSSERNRKLDARYNALKTDYEAVLQRLSMLETKLASKEQNNLEGFDERISQQNDRLKNFVESANKTTKDTQSLKEPRK